jgi:hypothetical protein
VITPISPEVHAALAAVRTLEHGRDHPRSLVESGGRRSGGRSRPPHRQTRPVSVYRLVAAKRALVADVLEGAGGTGAISTAELIALIQSGAAAAHEGAEPDEPAEPGEVAQPEPPASEAALAPKGAVELYEAELQREIARGVLTAASARNYVRVARRFVELVEQRGDESLLEDETRALSAVSDSVARGESPKSMVLVARSVLRRLIPLWRARSGAA